MAFVLDLDTCALISSWNLLATTVKSVTYGMELHVGEHFVRSYGPQQASISA